MTWIAFGLSSTIDELNLTAKIFSFFSRLLNQPSNLIDLPLPRLSLPPSLFTDLIKRIVFRSRSDCLLLLLLFSDPISLPHGPKQAKSHTIGGGSNSSAEVQALSKELADLKVSVDLLDKERDFYFSKLRDIEILCQTPELDDLPIVVAVKKILYATDANEYALEEAQECLNQSLGLEADEKEETLKGEEQEEAEIQT